MHLKELIRFLVKIARNLQSSRSRFIRLTPNRKGRIFFYDKQNKKLFFIHSRGLIDSLVADQIYTNHDYSIDFRVDDLNFEYQNIIKSGKTPLIIDCGANIGLSAKFFSEKYPQSSVIAIEPNDGNISQAIVNCKGLDNINLINAAIGCESGFVEISNPNAESWAFQTKRSNANNSKEIITINNILNTHQNCRIFIVKIDIEGFECDLFRLNTEWINKCPLLIIELHDWMLPKSANSQNFLKAISNSNRDFVYKGENIFSISNDL